MFCWQVSSLRCVSMYGGMAIMMLFFLSILQPSAVKKVRGQEATSVDSGRP